MEKKSLYERFCEFILCYKNDGPTKNPAIETPKEKTFTEPVAKKHRAELYIRLKSGEEISFNDEELPGIAQWVREVTDYVNKNEPCFTINFESNIAKHCLLAVPYPNIESIQLHSTIDFETAEKMAREEEEKEENTPK